MRYDPNKHNRRSIRLPGFDYAQPGSYYVTIVTQGRECLFGEVVDGEMALSKYGDIAREEWERSTRLRPTLVLDAYVVMPNHLHGIVTLVGDPVVGAHSCAPLPATPPNTPLQRSPRSVASFVSQFKATVTRRINALRDSPGLAVWQRNYYEHIVRSDEDLERIRQYIETNPLHWASDLENVAGRPERVSVQKPSDDIEIILGTRTRCKP